MSNLNLMTSTIKLLERTTGTEENYTEKYWGLFGKLTDNQINYLRALCHQKDLVGIEKIINEWIQVYEK